MTQVNTILGLMAQTSIHAGTGQNTGIIDLPIQREGHNGWPCVFGSAVKGALRTRAEQDSLGNINDIFGSSSAEHAGAMMVSDARLVLFPVRSLTSQFKWVTCPAVLQRLVMDLSRFDQGSIAVDTLTFNDQSTAIVAHDIAENDALFLEEYRFSLAQKNLGNTITLLEKLMTQTNAADLLQQQLVIVSDDMFSHLVQHATPVNAHISIESKNKTAENLWYEESLPPETLLYIGLTASKARGKNALNAQAIMDEVTGLFSDKPWFQMGGNETVGMGWCAVTKFTTGEGV